MTYPGTPQMWCNDFEYEGSGYEEWRNKNYPRAARPARYRQADPEKAAAACRKYRALLKAQVLAHYGELCACCHTIDNLGIDHMSGGGSQHREQVVGAKCRAGYPFYRWLIRNNFPEGFQTLCMPCNASKREGERCRLDHSARASWPWIA